MCCPYHETSFSFPDHIFLENCPNAYFNWFFQWNDPICKAGYPVFLFDKIGWRKATLVVSVRFTSSYHTFLPMTTKALWIVILLFVSFTSFGQAPGCPMIDAGPDQNLTCANNCTDLTATILNTGLTNDYTVSSIPFNPPFATTGGTALFVGTDDVWGNATTLPFSFCFYGAAYNSVVVGANGLVTFDATQAGGFCEWSFTATCPTPGPPPGGLYNNTIFGAYHDIDPSVAGSGVDINYAVLGSPPCRTFVVNFNQVTQFDCNALQTTQQIVMYETTNVVEVYIHDKPVCASWNDGNALIGIQGPTGANGVTPPGRNTGPWAASNEAWRFTPSGAPNWVVTWYDSGGNVVGNGLTVTNVCPTATETYTAEIVYTNCDGTVVTVTDDVVVNVSNGFTTTQNVVDESCAGACDGEVTITPNGGSPPFTYDIGTGPQASGMFTGLCAGNYTVIVGDGTGCSGTVNVTVNSGGALTTTINGVDENCGAADGSATVAVNGGGAYNYEWFTDPALTNSTGQTTPTATNLTAGWYYVQVSDGNCTAVDSIQINQIGSLAIQGVNVSNSSCQCDGQLEILCAGAITFSIDGGNTFQAGNIFTNLCAGTYDVFVQDALGCTSDTTVTVGGTPPIQVTLNDTAICMGGMASITPLVSGGTAPYTYAWDNATTNATLVDAPTVNTTYCLVVTDVNGCLSQPTCVNVTVGPPLAVTPGPDETICAGESVAITATGTGGSGTGYLYTWDNGAGVGQSPVVSPTQTTTYTVILTDDCETPGDTAEVTVTVIQPPQINFVADTLGGCAPLAVQFTSSGVPPGSTCAWDFDDGGTSTDCDVTNYTFANGGCFDITLDVTTPDGCVAQAVIQDYICVDAQPIADFDISPQPTTIFNPNITLTNTTQGGVSYLWTIDVNGDITTTTDVNTFYQFPGEDSGTYPVCLVAYNALGCPDTVCYDVVIQDEVLVFVPNAFTPDGDGNNDVFLPVLSSYGVHDYEFLIFDRWGELVFSSESPGTAWDGAYKGGAVQDGVYVWKLKLTYDVNNEDAEFVGHVTLIR